MKEYHKIQTLFKREEKKPCKIIEGNWSLPEFEYLKDSQWIWTEKVDGTNIRVMWNGQQIIFGGKTDNAQIPAPLIAKLQSLFLGEDKIQMMRDKFGFSNGQDKMVSICFYGEGYGAKIQKDGINYKPDGVDFVLFDVKIGEWWLERSNVVEIATYFGLNVIPIIGQGTLLEAIEKTKIGFNSQWGDFPAEGIVVRPLIDLRSRKNERIIGKIKNKDFT